MADEPRRSGRATKGQHTKISDAEAAAASAAKSTKPKTSKATKRASDEGTEEDDDEEESDAIIRCICGITTEDDDEDEERMMICCDQCTCWQHNECMEVPLDEDKIPETYLCEICSPESHKELLEKIAKGEKPWEERAKDRETSKRGRKKKGGKRGKAASKTRPSEAPSEGSENVNGTRNSPAQVVKIETTAEGATSPTEEKPITSAPMPPPGGRQASGSKRKLRGEADEDTAAEPEKEPQTKVRKVATMPPKDQKPRGRQSSGSQVKALDKQGQAENDAPTQTELTFNVEDLKNEVRKKTASVLIKTLGEQIAQAQAAHTFTLPEGKKAENVALRLALEIENAVFVNHSNQPGEPNTAYRVRLRSMVFNLKKNPALRDRLLQSLLTPDEFSTMSTDEMASEELQKRTAAMKIQTEKQHVLVEEDGPRIRRTHKGEELVGDDRENGGGNESIFSTAPARRRESVAETESPTVASPSAGAASPRSPSFANSPTTTRPLQINTKGSPQIGHERKSSASTFNIQDVWSSVHSPDTETHRAGQEARKRQRPLPAAAGMANLSGGGAIDTEIDQLLNDDLESPPYSPTDYDSDPSVVWRGKLSMPGVADFFASARHVAGADLNSTLPWNMLIPQSMTVDGRISVEPAGEYLCGLRWSKTTDVIVVAVTPNGGMESQTEFDRLWAYFTDRKKYGVVGTASLPAVKDAYVIPLEAGAAQLPPFMELLEFNAVDEPRAERMILVTLVVRAGGAVPSAQATPRIPEAPTDTSAPTAPYAPAGSFHHEVNQVAPGMSPVTPHGGMTPQALHGGSNENVPPPASLAHQHQNQHQHPAQQQQQQPQQPQPNPVQSAAQFLGPLADTPVAKQVLAQSADLNAKQLGVVRGILERFPAARSNMAVFGQLLAEEWQH
ncbi:MAG: hypothetical protein M1832_006156 [Thelocarpon impressellum]|nr:MAG: hypothetical protein M1832_006156 [Thelocarpon impressellum]